MTGPHPDVATARLAVRHSVTDLAEGALVLVACSGGPDSLLLAAAAAFALPRAGLRAGAVVVDHGLQEGSAEVALRAARQCRELGLDPVELETVEVGTAGGMEAAARTARFAALEEVARRTGAAAVLLGHTLDDQAETVLLGLARGSGARSLAGMAPVRGLWRRPLLGVRRGQVLEAIAALGLEPWLDPSNTDPHGPRRSALRSRVLPVLTEVLGPGVPEALARTAEQLREDAEVLESLAAEVLARAAAAALVAPSDGDGPPARALDVPDPFAFLPQRQDSTSYAVGELEPAPAALRRRALHLAILAACPGAGSVSREHVLAVDALVVAYRGQGEVALPGGARCRRDRGMLIFSGP